MQIAKELAGFTSAETVKLQKGIGKKNIKVINSLEERFLSGCKKVGRISPEKAKIIFDQMKKAGRYSFNKSISSETTVETKDGKLKNILEI